MFQKSNAYVEVANKLTADFEYYGDHDLAEFAAKTQAEERAEDFFGLFGDANFSREEVFALAFFTGARWSAKYNLDLGSKDGGVRRIRGSSDTEKC